MKSLHLDKLEENITLEKQEKRCALTLYPLEKDKQFAAIFIDLTSPSSHEDAIRLLREKSLFQAKELLHRQVTMAQKMVEFLGESTAQTELLVQKLSLQDEQGIKPSAFPETGIKM